MNKGGTADFGFCKVTMVSADHSSSCLFENQVFNGGDPAAFVVRFGEYSIYHAGETNVFRDMKLIDELY